MGSKPSAGPSSRPGPATAKNAPKRTNGHAKAKQPEPIVIDLNDDEAQHDELDEDDDEVVAVAPPPKVVTKKGPPGRASDSSATNKAKASAAKGKARASAQPVAKPTRNAAREEEPMDVDDASNVDEEPSRKRVKYGPPGNQAKSNANTNANAGHSRSTKEQEAVARENARLARDNEDLRKEIETVNTARLCRLYSSMLIFAMRSSSVSGISTRSKSRKLCRYGRPSQSRRCKST